MTKCLFRITGLITLLTLCLTATLVADTPNSSLTPFIRYSKAAGHIETSVVHFRNAQGQELDLISAVHIGSSHYYRTLNDKFTEYDSVLYELVLPDAMAGRPLPAQLETDSGVSGLQSMIARSLGLTSQVSSVNYSAKNFVHADLTQNGLAQKMAQRQESLLGYLMKAMASSGSAKTADLGVTDEELAQLDLMSLMSGQTTTRDRKILRKLFAAALASSGGVLSAMSDTAIISERNLAALEVVEREARAGTQKMALFYGAAHMPDLKRGLEKQGWVAGKTEWIKAWSM